MDSHALPFKTIIFICINERPPGERECCHAKDSEALQRHLKALVKEHGLRGRVRVSKSGCMDRCEQGPNVMVFPDNLWYSHVTLEDADLIFQGVFDRLRRQDELPPRYRAV